MQNLLTDGIFNFRVLTMLDDLNCYAAELPNMIKIMKYAALQKAFGMKDIIQ